MSEQDKEAAELPCTSDQGYTLLREGCFVCKPVFDSHGNVIRPKLIKCNGFWCCSQCQMSYGLIEDGNEG